MEHAKEVVVVVLEAMPDFSTKKSITATGGCLCGGVTYLVTGPLRDVVACHCGQCRKTSGNYVTASSTNDDDLIIENHDTLTWYQSSNQAKRGFCNSCGGNLFWKHEHKDYTSIMAGTLELPTNLKITHHIYVADASDYHSFHENDVTYAQDD